MEGEQKRKKNMKVSNDEKDLILRLGVGAGAADGINTFPYLKKEIFSPFVFIIYLQDMSDDNLIEERIET
jgi:hypothetical protein